MISNDDVKKLAALARIKLTPEEEQALSGDMENILEYVKQIQDVSANQRGKHEENKSTVRNVLRSDDAPHERGAYASELLTAVPERHEGYVKVKKIL